MSDEETALAPATNIGEPVIDMEHVNGELLAAWATAQERAKSVAKEGRNKDRNYDYATGDAMVMAGSIARATTGLCLFSTWSSEDVSDDGEGNQWVCAIVTVHWVMGHGSGGYVRGTITGHAIGSKGRPPDKAVAAAATYIEGFLDRGLMRLSRGGESADDVDARQEGDFRRRQAPRPQPKQAVPSWTKERMLHRSKSAAWRQGVIDSHEVDQAVARAVGLGINRAEAQAWFAPPEPDGTLTPEEEERMEAEMREQRETDALERAVSE